MVRPGMMARPFCVWGRTIPNKASALMSEYPRRTRLSTKPRWRSFYTGRSNANGLTLGMHGVLAIGART